MRYQVWANCYAAWPATEQPGNGKRKSIKAVMRVPVSDPLEDFEQARAVARQKNKAARQSGQKTIYVVREV